MNHLTSFYINNYKCLQNFELQFDESTTGLLLLAKNGMGKSTVLSALRILRRIALGEGDVSRLFSLSDFAFGNVASPIRFRLLLATDSGEIAYELAVGTRDSRRLVVEEESLVCANKTVFNRKGNAFLHDKQLMLSLVREAEVLTSVLADWILVMPVPLLMSEGQRSARKLDYDCGNFISWFRHLLGDHPAGYADFERELKIALPDCESFLWNDPMEEPADNLYLTFSSDGVHLPKIAFSSLSDGEKIAVLGAALIALSCIKPGFFCFWDEPDNFLSTSEVQNFIMRLRKYLRIGECQLLVTSHNISTIQTMGVDNAVILHRDSHYEPTRLIWCADKFKTVTDREHYIDDVLSGEIYVD